MIDPATLLAVAAFLLINVGAVLELRAGSIDEQSGRDLDRGQAPVAE